MTPNPTPSDPNKALDIYNPKNPNFINPNDVLAMHPDDTAARYASTRPDVVQATTLRSVQSQIATLNANLKSNYLTAFDNWLISWNAARILDKSTAPQPPNGYVVGYFGDPTTGPGTAGPYGDAVVQWAYPEIGKDPVCARPAIPDAPKQYVPPDPNTPPLGELGIKANATAVDGFPVGYQATRVDGSVWQKFVAQTPFGTAWYWECVKAGVS